MQKYFSQSVKTLLLRIFILSFYMYEERVIGMLTLSPEMEAPVCRVGDPLQLTCTASVQFIKWSILKGNERITEDLQVNSRDANQIKQIEDDIATFTFIRSSAQGASPLVSTLSIDSVSIGLNGTVVRCSDVANPVISASTAVYIINSNNIQYIPALNVSERFGTNNVIVTVQWAEKISVRYTTRISPLALLILTGNTNRQLVLLYNTEYHLSVVADPPCGDNATAVITLNYANCGYPELLSIVSGNDSVPNNVGIDDIIPVEGTTITFSCPPGLVLNGSNSATCMENGEWEPDPNGLMCTDSKDGDRSDKSSMIIAGGFLGALLVILLVLLAIVGTIIKNDSLWRQLQHVRRKNLTFNVELNKEHNSTIHEQQNDDTKESIVYAVIGPFSSDQSRTLETFKFDEDRMEYAKINYNIMPQNPIPVSLVEKVTESDEDISMNLDSLLIQLQDKVTKKWHQFGVALGVEKEILDQCLKYPPEQGIVEMLDHWLRSYDCEKRNWRDVARALRQIEHHQLAKEIESIDKTESDDVPDNVLQQSESDSAEESPFPKKCHDFKDNPEHIQHGDIIKYNLPS